MCRQRRCISLCRWFDHTHQRLSAVSEKDKRQFDRIKNWRRLKKRLERRSFLLFLFFFYFFIYFLISQKWPSNFDLVPTLVSQSGQLFRILFWKEKVEEREEENQVSVHFRFLVLYLECCTTCTTTTIIPAVYVLYVYNMTRLYSWNFFAPQLQPDKTLGPCVVTFWMCRCAPERWQQQFRTSASRWRQ
jgi:hypothetical protein